VDETSQAPNEKHAPHQPPRPGGQAHAGSDQPARGRRV